MRILGIDPGKDGFLALIPDDGPPEFAQTPTLNISARGSKRGYDVRGMCRLIRKMWPSYVILEKQQAMPKQGVASTFSTGYGMGLWEGIVVALDIPYVIVHPRRWQKSMHSDIQGDNTKAKSIMAAQRLFPKVDLRISTRARKPHDGKADALLLAAYGLRIL